MGITKKFGIAATKKPSTNKYTFRKFLFWSFNSIVGYAFIIGLRQAYGPVGYIVIVVMFIGAGVSLFVGISFGKLSTKYSTNGGSYLYTRQITKHRGFSWFVGFIQYIQAPFVGVSSIFGIIWAFHGIEVHGRSLDSYWYISVVAFCVLAFAIAVMSFGFTSTNITLYILWSLKWLVIISSMVVAIVVSGVTDRFASNIATGGNNYAPKLSLEAMVTSLITFFFAFGGIEQMAVISDDIEDPDKNMYKSIIATLLLSLLFYIVYFYLILGAVGSEVGDPNSLQGNNNSSSDWNPINALFGKLFDPAPKGTEQTLSFGVSAATTIIILIIVLSQIANKGTSRFQNGWVNARILATLAADGFLPYSLSTKNKYKQFTKALYVDGLMTLIIALPLVIVKYTVGLNLASSLDLYTISAFAQYIGVFIVFIYGYHKKIDKINEFKVFTVVCSYIGLFVVSFLTCAYFVYGFIDFAAYCKGGDNQTIDNLGIIIVTGISLVSGLIAIALYFYGKKFWWKNKQLSSEVHDFWTHGNGQNKSVNDFTNIELVN